MAFTRYQILLSVLMVATGTINSLSVKWVDRLDAKGSDGKSRKFYHPFIQSCSMFLGEMLCLLTFKILRTYYTRRQVVVEDIEMVRGNQNFNPFIFLPPAMFDMVATSLMYIGLELTSVSNFQMLRGSVIVFVALLSTSFVGRIIEKHQWYGIAVVVIGLFAVGFSDVTGNPKTDRNDAITGDLLIIMAQIIVACQMVYEEKFVVDKDIPPLQAVGWEGVFGFTVLSLLLVPFYYIPAPVPFSKKNPRGVLEDLPDAIAQITNNLWILLGITGTTISIAFFNFAGISMTKEISSTTRMVLDSVRTFFIWMFSLAFLWQDFYVFQLLGFVILLFGMVLYYNLQRVSISEIRIFGRSLRTSHSQDRDEPIINQRADEA